MQHERASHGHSPQVQVPLGQNIESMKPMCRVSSHYHLLCGGSHRENWTQAYQQHKFRDSRGPSPGCHLCLSFSCFTLGSPSHRIWSPRSKSFRQSCDSNMQHSNGHCRGTWGKRSFVYSNWMVTMGRMGSGAGHHVESNLSMKNMGSRPGEDAARSEGTQPLCPPWIPKSTRVQLGV